MAVCIKCSSKKKLDIWFQDKDGNDLCSKCFIES